MSKTVTTYSIDREPKGTQYASISNKICQMFVVPRSNLSYLNTQEKLQKPAFYNYWAKMNQLTRRHTLVKWKIIKSM